MSNAVDIINQMSLGRAEILFYCDSSQRIRTWGCWASTNSEGNWGIFYTDGLIDGKVKDPTFKASTEKNVGKVNYLSCEMQAYEMVKQEIGKKEKDNYFYTPEDAKKYKEFRPMLCPSGMKWADYKVGGKKASKVTYPALASPKLDGARANRYLNFKNETVIRTREGREWLNFDHIKTDHAFQNFSKDFPSVILDGEMYNHQFKDDFEALMSIFRQEKPTPEERQLSKNVAKFYVYDIYDRNRPDLTAYERQMFLVEITRTYFMDCAFFVPLLSKVVYNEQEYDELHNRWTEEGYEGSILRILDAPYGVESRSGELLKRKEVFDCEFEITGVFEGEGSKAGLAGGVLITLKNPAGMNADDVAKLDQTAEQKAGLARGWDDEKARKLWLNAKDYIGKQGTIEYFGITAYGKLRFPKFKALRHD